VPGRYANRSDVESGGFSWSRGHRESPVLTVDVWEFDRLHKQADAATLHQAITLYAGDLVTMTYMSKPSSSRQHNTAINVSASTIGAALA